MFELELKNLLAMSATVSTVASCEDYIRRLETLKTTILRLGNKMELASIDQINSIDRMISKLDRKADELAAEDEFRKRDKLKEEVARRNDKYRVETVVDELQARKGYKA